MSIRLVHVQAIDASPASHLMLGDAESYTRWALSLVSGNWTGDEVFYQAPLYPYFLGALFSLFDADATTIRIAQALIGALACVFLALAGRRWFSPGVGLTAGAMLALYAPAIFFVGLVQKTTLALGLFTLVLWLLSVATTSRHAALPLWVAVGSGLAATALARENALVLTLPIAVWILLSRASGESSFRWQRFAAFAMGLGLILGPVAARNFAVGGAFALTTSQLGTNLYIGNNDRANGTYQPLRAGRDDTRFEADDAKAIAEANAGRSLSSGEVSSVYVGAVVDFITTQPGAWARLMGRKVLLALNAVELADTEDLQTHADASLALGIANRWWHFGVLFPLALVGAVLSVTRDDRRLLLYGIVAVYGASLVAFFIFARYRFLPVPVLMMFAAAAFPALWRLLSSPTLSRVGLAAGAAGAACLISYQPLLESETMQAVTHFNYGLGFERENRDDLARESYEKALSFHPTNAEAHFRIGVLAMREAQLDSARHHLESAVRLSPQLQAARNSLGALLVEQGEPESAEVHFREALRLLPGDPQALNNLANLAFRRNELREAQSMYRRSLEADPQNPQTHNNLGIISAIRGDFSDAVGYFQNALRLDPNYEEARLNLARAQLGHLSHVRCDD